VGNSPSASQEHIVTETFIPAYESSEEVCAETEELFTISSVPASRGYISFLQRERLEALLTPNSVNAEELNVSYLFKEFEGVEGSSELFTPPLAVSLSRLCDGRVSLKDAMASLGWSTNSNLEIANNNGLVSVLEVQGGKSRISKAQSRLTIPLAIRRWKKWENGTDLLVVSFDSPGKYVLIYGIHDILKQVMKGT